MTMLQDLMGSRKVLSRQSHWQIDPRTFPLKCCFQKNHTSGPFLPLQQLTVQWTSEWPTNKNSSKERKIESAERELTRAGKTPKLVYVNWSKHRTSGSPDWNSKQKSWLGNSPRKEIKSSSKECKLNSSSTETRTTISSKKYNSDLPSTEFTSEKFERTTSIDPTTCDSNSSFPLSSNALNTSTLSIRLLEGTPVAIRIPKEGNNHILWKESGVQVLQHSFCRWTHWTRGNRG